VTLYAGDGVRYCWGRAWNYRRW